jgi:squalene-hopene/tetraprenyl-beta-curcumene cyclase
VVSLRNIAPKSLPNKVRLEVFTVDESAGTPKPGRALAQREQDGRQGPMSFFWDGKATDGGAQPNGKYLARLTFLDGAGKSVQSEQMVFAHDTPEAVRETYGEISGAIALPAAAGGMGSANTRVELVDEQGRVVQEAVSTDEGQYRFKNVDSGKKFKVRVAKPGYKAIEKDVESEKGADKPADLLLE